MVKTIETNLNDNKIKKNKKKLTLKVASLNNSQKNTFWKVYFLNNPRVGYFWTNLIPGDLKDLSPLLRESKVQTKIKTFNLKIGEIKKIAIFLNCSHTLNKTFHSGYKYK